MNLSLYFLIMDIFTIAGTPRRGIIIATSSTQFLPNQINSLLKILNRPFCYEFKIEFSSIWQRKLSQSHIRGKKLILLTILFVRNPSLDDDFDKLCKEIGLFMYPASPVQTAASYRGGTKVKISRYTLISNLSYMHNTRELHDAMTISTNYAKKLVFSCIRPVWYKPWRPTEDELKLKSRDIP